MTEQVIKNLQSGRVSRRQFLQILGFSGAAAAAWKIGISPQLAGPVEVSVSRLLMGTVVNLTVIGEDKGAAEKAVAATLDHMASLESILSRFRPDSELSQLNRTGRLNQASPPLLALLRLSRKMGDQSEGAFDITVKPLVDLYQRYQMQGSLPPDAEVQENLALVNYRDMNVSGNQVSLAKAGMAITLDGIGKGYIVDEGVVVLREHGFENVLVEAGGDLLAAGQKQSGPAANNSWQIGVRSPRGAATDLLAHFGAQNEAVATSGDYQQPYSTDFSLHHIIDPRTGYSNPELASVTAIAPQAALADALATAVMVLGIEKGLALAQSQPGCEALLITKELEMRGTAGFSV